MHTETSDLWNKGIIKKKASGLKLMRGKDNFPFLSPQKALPCSVRSDRNNTGLLYMTERWEKTSGPTRLRGRGKVKVRPTLWRAERVKGQRKEKERGAEVRTWVPERRAISC